MSTRTAVKSLYFVLVAVHVCALLFFPDQRTASLLSNVLQLVAAVCVVGTSVWAARLTAGALRIWWWCSALAALQWSLGQAQFVYYENILHRNVPTNSPLGPLLFLFFAPLWLGLLLLRTRGSRLDRLSVFFDFAQVMVVAAAGYLRVFYVPVHWSSDTQTAVLTYVYDFRNLAMVVAIWLVYSDELQDEVRAVLRYFGVAFALYGLGEVYYFHFTPRGAILSGTLIDLTWTVPLAIVGYASAVAPRTTSVPVSRSTTSGINYSRIVPVILPLMAAFLALQLYAYVPLRAAIILFATLGLHAGRVLTDGQIRRRAIADLRAEQLKFDAVTSSANAAILIHQDGNIVYTNPFMERFTGYSGPELHGIHVARLLLEQDHPLLFERLAKRASGIDVPNQVELPIVTKAGLVRWMEIATTTIELGAKPAVLIIGFDVTARKVSESALADTVSLLEATIESTADGILVVDREQKVVRYNARFATMWGLTQLVQQEHDDRKLVAAVLEKVRDPKGFVKRIADLYLSPEAESFDVIELKDGRTFERLSRPQVLEGNIIGRVWSFRDMTQSRRLEEQLRHSQKMEAVGTLAGGIAHDFNNLLTIIIGYGALAQSRVPENQQLQGDLHHICRSAEQAAALTRQLLTFSRKQPLHPIVFNVNDAIGHTLQLLRRVLGEDIRLETGLSSAPAYIEADRTQIDQLLVNLAINARDAMPNGGVLRFTTRRTETDPSCIEITVSDTGHGIPDEVLPHIFEPFFTTKEMGRGTGLGLATAYATVQQCRGTIQVETKNGTGTTFTIRIPEAANVAAPKAAISMDSPGGSARIMVVEDEQSVRELCSSILTSRGYTVVQSAAAQDAIAIFEQHRQRFDLVLTDVIMPDLSGEELARRLRAQIPGLKVLFMSGYDKAGSNSDPISPLLMKPFTPAELLSKVKQVLSAAANN